MGRSHLLHVKENLGILAFSATLISPLFDYCDVVFIDVTVAQVSRGFKTAVCASYAELKTIVTPSLPTSIP